MKTSTHTTLAENVGRTLGHGWAAYKQQEAHVVRWVIGKGLSSGTANLALWAVKLLALGILLYVAFWVALLLVLAVVAAWLARNADDDSEPGEWRNGTEGYGYYEKGVRTDSGRLFEDDQT